MYLAWPYVKPITTDEISQKSLPLHLYQLVFNQVKKNKDDNNHKREALKSDVMTNEHQHL